MKLKSQIFGTALSLLVIASSCKKDVVSEEAAQAATVSSDATAADAVAETDPPVYKAITTNAVISNSDGYLEILPARYSLTTKSYPFILFIHGIGELGTGVGRLTCCGLPYYVAKKTFPAEFVVNGQHFSYIVMAPQFRVRPSAADMQNCINYAVKHYRIDPNRIYISGLSMGGGSTWDYSAVYGQNVAAAVPVCGGTAPTTALAKAVASKNLPVWTISSKTDALVPIAWATNWISWIKADNPGNAANVKLTVLTANEDHNTTWAKAFNPANRWDGYNVYEWMLRYQRTGTGVTVTSPAPPPATTPTPPVTPAPPTTPAAAPVARAGADVTINKWWNFSPLLNGTTSTISGGWFVSAKWTKIAGPATYSIANANAFQTRVTLPEVGVYTFRLTVTTNKGATATDDINITVNP